LGYGSIGDDPVVTEVSYGPDGNHKFTTTYFRTTFDYTPTRNEYWGEFLLIDKSHIVSGTNTLAVEVHQGGLTSSVLGLDIEIIVDPGDLYRTINILLLMPVMMEKKMWRPELWIWEVQTQHCQRMGPMIN
jgi:hypothetical protein